MMCVWEQQDGNKVESIRINSTVHFCIRVLEMQAQPAGRQFVVVRIKVSNLWPTDFFFLACSVVGLLFFEWAARYSEAQTTGFVASVSYVLLLGGLSISLFALAVTRTAVKGFYNKRSNETGAKKLLSMQRDVEKERGSCSYITRHHGTTG